MKSAKCSRAVLRCAAREHTTRHRHALPLLAIGDRGPPARSKQPGISGGWVGPLLHLRQAHAMPAAPAAAHLNVRSVTGLVPNASFLRSASPSPSTRHVSRCPSPRPHSR